MRIGTRLHGHSLSVAVLMALLIVAHMPATASLEDPRRDLEVRNTAVVLDFLDTLIAKRDVAKAMVHLDERYIQHNPNMPTGKAAAAAAFAALSAGMKDLKMEVKRTMAEGDMVAVHSHGTRYPGDRGVAVADFYRLENGKIVEHWDVIQEVPEQAKNPNTMF